MPHQPAPQICLQLPDGPDRDALRAGLMAMNVIPANLPPPGPALSAALDRLAQDPQALVWFDISNPLPRVLHRFDRMLKNWPQALRARTTLTRLAGGHVGPSDRQWVQSLGFVDLVAAFDDHGPSSALRRSLDLVAAKVGSPPLPDNDLVRYLRAIPRPASGLSPRALIRARTGLAAESLADLLQFKLDIRDRSYHLRKYPACLVARDAVQWMRQHFQLDVPHTVEVGQALQALGLLYHVAHEKTFAEEELFFRLRAPAQLAQVNIGLAWRDLRERLVVVDRTYLGKTYPSCWIGNDAVSLLAARRSITRHESELLLHRMMQFGFFEHVVGEQGFIDGHYFYRSNDALA